MIFITDEKEIKNSTGICAIYFYAQWLHFHKKMLLMIDKIESGNKDIIFYAVDVDSFAGLCKRYDVKSIPTVIITGDEGAELKRINGLPLTSGFKKTFSDIYKSYNPPHERELK